MIITYQGKTPSVDPTAFIAPNATLIGDVTIGPDASVWFGAVLRGDNEPIVVGRGSNVQDNATLHCDPGHPLTIGEDVTIGHNAVVHGCTVGNGVLVGMGAVVLDEAVLGDWSIVGAGLFADAGHPRQGGKDRSAGPEGDESGKRQRIRGPEERLYGGAVSAIGKAACRLSYAKTASRPGGGFCLSFFTCGRGPGVRCEGRGRGGPAPGGARDRRRRRQPASRPGAG